MEDPGFVSWAMWTLQGMFQDYVERVRDDDYS
jgi:hypothetical protein